MDNILFYIGLFLLVAFVLLAIVEAFLRIFHSGKKYYVMPPNLNEKFCVKKHIIPGVEGRGCFTTNSYGLRGPELPSKVSDNDYIILFLGGSTTECGFIDDHDAWPYRVMEQLNSFSSKYNVIAENSGRSTHSTRNNILILERLLSGIKVSCAVVLPGTNDILLTLRKHYNPDFLEDKDNIKKLLQKTFWNLNYESAPNQPFYKNLFIWRSLEKAKRLYIECIALDRTGEGYVEEREKREKAEKVSISYDPIISERISLGLKEYKKNIEKMISICREKKVRLIFMDYPALWGRELPDNFRKLFWLGKAHFLSSKEKDIYLNEEDLSFILDKYNIELKNICMKNNIEFISLADRVSRDVENFYDEVHFNTKGSKEVADIVVNYLKDKL